MIHSKGENIMTLFAILAIAVFGVLLYLNLRIISLKVTSKRIVNRVRNTYDMQIIDQSGVDITNELTSIEENILFNRSVDTNLTKYSEFLSLVFPNFYNRDIEKFKENLLDYESHIFLEGQFILRSIKIIELNNKKLSVTTAIFSLLDGDYELSKEWAIYLDNELIFTGDFRLDPTSTYTDRIEEFRYKLNKNRDIQIVVLYKLLRKDGECYFFKVEKHLLGDDAMRGFDNGEEQI